VSEDVVLSSEIETGVFFTMYTDGVLTLMDKECARKLRDELNEFLEEDTRLAKTGIQFPQGCDEPDVPVGTKLMDNTGDILEKLNDNPDKKNWRWTLIGGERQSYDGSCYTWSFVQDNYSFTVVA
jgi:hypothetical protein